jgi:hypothetical protein
MPVVQHVKRIGEDGKRMMSVTLLYEGSGVNVR